MFKELLWRASAKQKGSLSNYKQYSQGSTDKLYLIYQNCEHLQMVLSTCKSDEADLQLKINKLLSFELAYLSLLRGLKDT